MRVSDSMMSDLVRRGIDQSRARFYEAQRAASTGLRVGKPSDDPVASEGARAETATLRRAETVASTARTALDELESVDSTLAEVVDVLSRAHELGVAAANDTLTAEDRSSMATEARALRAQLHALSNTRVGDRYVFGGLAVGSPPFDATGAYVGSAVLAELDVGHGVRLPTQVSGERAFGAGTASDAFAALDALATALDANDRAAIRAGLDPLAGAVSNAANARAEAGAAQSSLSMAQAAAHRVRDHAETRRAALVEIEPFVAFSELTKAESALQQAVMLASRMPATSLDGGR